MLHGVLCGLMLQGHTAGLFCPYAVGHRFPLSRPWRNKDSYPRLKAYDKVSRMSPEGPDQFLLGAMLSKGRISKSLSSESVWILKSAVKSVCLRPLDPGRGGD